MKPITASLVVMSLLLTACGASEPTSEEIATAYTAQMRKDFAMLWGAKKAEEISLTNVKKLACKSGGDSPGVRCDFDLKINQKSYKPTETTLSVRFAKSDGVWVVIGR